MKQQYRLKNGEDITIISLTTDHLTDILALQQQVMATLTSESFLQPLSEEEFLYLLNGKGFMIGAYHKERLVAFRAMLEPDLDEEHLGKDAGLPRNEWPLVLYSEVSNVHPHFRGNNLQVVLGKIIMQQVDEQLFRYVCATVAPFNIASLKDKFAHGMQIVALQVKYGGLLRYILMKDLANSAETNRFFESCQILMADTEKQQQYLQDGWKGTGIEQVNDQWIVCFEK